MSESEFEKGEPMRLRKDGDRDPLTGGKTSDPVEPLPQTVDPPTRGGGDDEK